MITLPSIFIVFTVCQALFQVLYLWSRYYHSVSPMKKLRHREIKWVVKIMRLVDGEIGIWTQAVWLQIWFILSFGLTLRSVSTLQCKLFPCYTLPLSSHFIWSLKQNITSEFRQWKSNWTQTQKETGASHLIRVIAF